MTLDFFSLGINAQENKTSTTDAITQYGITWKFDKPTPSGQFVNGDYWVVGPVKIIGIDPPSVERVGTTTITGFALGGTDPVPRTMNGSMLNPLPTAGAPKEGKQGYDSDMYEWHPKLGRKYPGNYDASLNVALGVNPTHPLVLPPDSSLISSISDEKGTRPQIKTAAILTVLASIPPDNGATSFRPPYVGSSKPLYSIKGLRKDRLPNLPLVANMPDLKAVINQFQRPWIDHFNHHGDGTQFSSPPENMPTYGLDYCIAVGNASLMLMLKESDLVTKYGQNKDALLIRLVQVGIDLYHSSENGGFWRANGGLNSGRKWPILFAGLMLDNPRMQTIGSRSNQMPFWGFHEDCQTAYLKKEDIDVTHSPKWNPDKRAKQLIPYEATDVNLPEWCIGGYSSESELVKTTSLNKFFAVPYRSINGPAFVNIVLPVLLMGQKEAWKHDALFDYTDRYVAWAPQENPTWNAEQKALYTYGGKFQQAMWEAYRGNKPGLK